MEQKIVLTIKEQIDRNLQGRKQKWIVQELNNLGNSLSEVQFSNKKNGYEEFNEKELTDLSSILGTSISA